MPYTTVLFEPAQHRPEPFLGERVELPELEGYTPRMRAVWENPILSFEQAQEFMELAGWFAAGYDQKLAPPHWGVFTARTLEAMCFRFADMCQEHPRWGRREGDDVARIAVHCEGRNMHNLARDLVVSLFHAPGTNPAEEDFKGQVENPAVDRDFLTKEDEGNARVRAFWAPMEVAMVVNALAAWEAMRFTEQKDAAGKPRRFAIDLDLVRAKGVVAAMESLFGPAFQARMQAHALDAGSPSSAGASHSSPRL